MAAKRKTKKSAAAIRRGIRPNPAKTMYRRTVRNAKKTAAPAEVEAPKGLAACPHQKRGWCENCVISSVKWSEESRTFLRWRAEATEARLAEVQTDFTAERTRRQTLEMALGMVPVPPTGTGVAILCVTPRMSETNPRVWLAQRAATHSPFPELWECPGGSLNAGEAPHVGALRELREETGIETKLLIPVGYVRFTNKEFDAGMFLYITELTDGVEPNNTEPNMRSAWESFPLHNVLSNLTPATGALLAVARVMYPTLPSVAAVTTDQL